MSNKLDPLKKERYKQSRLQGKNKAQSMLDVGCAKTTAYHDSKDSVLVKTCEQELMNEVKASDITVEWVVNQLTKELVAPDAKASDRIRVSELLGKYIAMFNDNKPLQVNLFTGDMLKDLPPIDVINDVSSSNSKG